MEQRIKELELELEMYKVRAESAEALYTYQSILTERVMVLLSREEKKEFKKKTIWTLFS